MFLYRSILVVSVLAVMLPLAWGQPGLPPEIQSEIQALKKEPSIQQTQQAALRFFNIDAGAVQAMRGRASLKGLMPQLEARYRQNNSNLDVGTRNTTIQDDPFLFDTVQGRVHEFQVGLRWNLPALIFNPEVLDVGSLAILQEGVLKEVTRLYYTRRRLQIDLILNPPNDAGTRISKELRIDELTSTIDAMTGELFSRAKRRRHQRRSRNPGGDDSTEILRPLTPMQR